MFWSSFANSWPFNLLVAFGLAYMAIDARLLERPRAFIKRLAFFDKLLSCYACTGFWCGLTVYAAVQLIDYVNEPFVAAISWPTLAGGAVFFALASSAFCWFASTVVDSILSITDALITLAKR